MVEQTPNFAIKESLVWDFVPPLGWALEVFGKVRANKGFDKVRGLHQVTREDLSAVTIEFNEEDAIMTDKFNIGQYFNQYASKMIPGPLPTGQFKDLTEKPAYKQAVLLLAFVRDEADLHDSSLAFDEQSYQGVVDLTDTLQYKLLVVAGQLVKVNKKLKKQMVWVEDTRSVMLREDQKSQLCYLMDASQEVA